MKKAKIDSSAATVTDGLASCNMYVYNVFSNDNIMIHVMLPWINTIEDLLALSRCCKRFLRICFRDGQPLQRLFYIMEQHNGEMNGAFAMASKLGDIRCLDYMFRHFSGTLTDPERAYRSAAKHGRLHALSFLDHAMSEWLRQNVDMNIPRDAKGFPIINSVADIFTGIFGGQTKGALQHATLANGMDVIDIAIDPDFDPLDPPPPPPTSQEPLGVTNANGKRERRDEGDDGATATKNKPVRKFQFSDFGLFKCRCQAMIGAITSREMKNVTYVMNNIIKNDISMLDFGAIIDVAIQYDVRECVNMVDEWHASGKTRDRVLPAVIARLKHSCAAKTTNYYFFDHYLRLVMESEGTCAYLEEHVEEVLSMCAALSGIDLLIHAKKCLERAFPERDIDWEKVYCRVSAEISGCMDQHMEMYARIRKFVTKTIDRTSKSLRWIKPLAMNHFSKRLEKDDKAIPYGAHVDPTSRKQYLDKEHFLYDVQAPYLRRASIGKYLKDMIRLFERDGDNE